MEDVIYQFGPFELDLATVELRSEGEGRGLEPQVFALLALLIENHGRVVSKDEIVQKVWGGRIVSDAAIASRVKSARQALGDDGRSQRFIRTLHSQGYRFIADVKAVRRAPSSLLVASDAAGSAQDAAGIVRELHRLSRPSLAVLRFRAVGGGPFQEALASALPADLITELSRLRWLFVTARGSSFRVPIDSGIAEVGRLLGVRYLLCGNLEAADARLDVAVELVDTHDGGIVWADRFSGRIDDVHAMREDIRARALTALDIHIPLHEAAMARLGVPDDLDAWSAYHVGLQQVYRFNRAGNAAAHQLFQRAVTLDPRFARAHAGLSFVHFQAAFMGYPHETADPAGEARRCAERGLEFDPLDPFVNFTMGRSYWLEGDLDSSLAWLERATRMSPNYAQGVYAQAWAEALSGSALEGRAHVDLAMRLSPIDPLYYAMMATRAFTHMVLGEDAEAAHWADRGARAPGAHVWIAMIAAAAHALNGDRALAASWAANVRQRDPALDQAGFFHAFPMRPDAVRGRVSQALAELGF